jgi:hypothetical protein
MSVHKQLFGVGGVHVETGVVFDDVLDVARDHLDGDVTQGGQQLGAVG